MIGSVVAGRFKIERKAGSGGMGTVYRAHDLLSGTPAALKLLDSDEVRDVERFVQEAAILARLAHPAIVRYLAHGAAGGKQYVAMEWLEGIDLDIYAERQPLTLHGTLHVLRRVTQALDHAHQQGIIHRDIKPANLFLPGGDLAGLKVIDFGIARLLKVARRLTMTGVMVGTPGYLAPEVITGARDLDGRTDFFSLGCVAFRCLTGRPPFEADDPGTLMAKLVLEEAPSVRDLAPAVPEPVAALVKWLLAREPEGRPRDGREILAALDGLGDLSEQKAHYHRRRTTLSLTGTEQRVICVVLIGPAPVDPTASAFAPLSSSTALEDELRTRLEAAVHPLPGGRLLVTLPARGKPTDLAARAARAALAACRHLPGRPVVVLSGQASATVGPAELAPLLARGEPLLRETPPGRIRLQEMVSTLLGSGFAVAPVAGGGGVFLEGERDALERRHVLLGRPSEFVGRARELQGLLAMLTACTDEGTAQSALAIGPAGIGKTRLREEFLEAARRQSGGALTVLYGSGDALGAGAPFGMLAGALRRLSGVRDGEPVEDSRRKLEAAVAAPLLPGDRARVVAFLGEMAHVPFPDGQHEALRAARSSPQLMGDLMRRAVEDWLAAACAAQPVLILLEDLHWGDAGTVGLIDSVLRNLREQSLMVLAMARPELRQTFPDLWAGRGLQVLELGPLPRKVAEKLVKEALGASASPAAVAGMVARADGNPLYLEELIRATRDGRTEGLPDSVLGMVQARLDVEGPQAKRVLRAASVFGDRFSRAGLSALLGGEAESAEIAEWVERLIDRELLGRGTAPEGSEGELVFAHGLCRDAAYAMLTEEDRRLGHRLAGAHLEEAGCPEAMVLAEHYRRGLALARAAHWYARAAEQALRACDLPGALARAGHGLEAIAGLGPEGGGEELGVETAGALRLVQAEAHLWRGELEPALERGGEAVAALEAGAALWYRAVSQTMVAAAKQGRVEALDGWVARAAGAVAAPGASSMQVVCFSWATSSLLMVGRLEAADALMERLGAALATLADPDPLTLALVAQARAWRASMQGDPAACLGALQSAQAAFDRAGDVRNAATLRANVGFMLAELGQWQGASGVLGEALVEAERMALSELQAIVQHNLGRVLAVRGDPAEGERLLRVSIAYFAAHGELRLEGIARLYLAEVQLRGGAAAAGEEEARAALRVLGHTPAARVQALGLLARSQLAQGRVAEALAVAEEAAAGLAALGSIDEGEAEVRLVHGECLGAAGRGAEAALVMAQARTRLLDRAGRIADPTLRGHFLADIDAHARTMAGEEEITVFAE